MPDTHELIEISPETSYPERQSAVVVRISTVDSAPADSCGVVENDLVYILHPALPAMVPD